MTNLYWYIILAVIGIGIGIYVIYVKRDIYKMSTLIVFYLFSVSITWIGEFIVLGLFNAYAYKTGVFENPWEQNLLGHLILNSTLYPAVAMVMVAYSLKYGWISLVSALFIFLEYSFLKLGIYEQHWWRYYLTVIVVVVFLLLSRYWFLKIIQKPYGLIRTVTFYFAAMLVIHTPAPILLLLDKQYYKLSLINNIFGDLYLSSIIVIFCYHLLEAFLLVLFTCVLKKWFWKAVPFIISITVQSIFVKMNILIINDGWNLFYTIFIYEIFIAIFIVIEKYSLRQKASLTGLTEFTD